MQIPARRATKRHAFVLPLAGSFFIALPTTILRMIQHTMIMPSAIRYGLSVVRTFNTSSTLIASILINLLS
jgi:hypothetical protein